MAPVPPQKVSEVKKWLAANPGVDPQVLVAGGKQKAAAQAAAVRALAGIASPAALDALTTYRPEIGPLGPDQQGGFGDTFTNPVIKELLPAWDAWDRRVFADEMFSGIGTLKIGNGMASDLTGLDAAAGLTSLHTMVEPQVDLAPIAACAHVSRLQLNVQARTDGSSLAPLTSIGALQHLALVNSHALDSIASLAGLRVTTLVVSVGPAVDLTPLTTMPSLTKLKLGTDKSDVSNPAAVAAIQALVARGVEVVVYTHAGWTAAVLAAPGVTAVEQSGYLALTKDASRAEALKSSLWTNRFPH